MLESVPPGATTWTVPVVAPVGTVAVISEAELTMKEVAGVPLKVTLVAPVSWVPKILTVVFTLPDVGNVLINGPTPIDRLKTVP